jgi:YXWGXW repeat-containing protein
MNPIQRLISAGFATAALLSASVPALAWTVWPDVDFEWYADVGHAVGGPAVEVYPAARAGYIWAPGHWETRGVRQAWIAGHWVADDYNEQLAAYGSQSRYASARPILLDRDGNVIPASPGYPADAARR